MRIEIPDEEYYENRIIVFNVSHKGRAEINEVIRLLRGAGVRGRILDVGCGPGLNVAALREASEDWKPIGVDFSPKGIEIAMREVGGNFLNVDAHHLSFRDESFQAVVMTHAIGHVAEPEIVLAEIRRVLTAGGTLVVTTPNRLYVEVYREFNERGLISYRRDPTVLRYYDRDSLEEALSAAGLKAKSVCAFGSFPALETRFLEMGLLPSDLRLEDEERRERLIALATKEDP